MTYTRTPAGSEELVAKKLPLSIPTRRLLGLIVGEVSHEYLVQLIRGGELDRMLNDLVNRGLVQGNDPLPVLAAASSQQPARAIAVSRGPAAPVEALQAQRVPTIKRLAARFVLDHLGPNGEGIAMRVESAPDMSHLEHEVYEIRRVLLDLRGRAVSEKFYETVIVPSFGAGA